MSVIKSITELSHDQIRDTWYNCSQIYADLYEFYRSSLVSVLDDSGFELEHKHLPPHSFLENLEVCISCGPADSLLKNETWEKICSHLYLGVWIDEEKGNQMGFYTQLEFEEEFHQNFFHKSSKATRIRETLESKGWSFEFDEERWVLRIVKPADDIDFSKPTWKKDLKKFYEATLTDLTETVLKTKTWLD
jgi:hypothetical protein